jgi:hypothetical protein
MSNSPSGDEEIRLVPRDKSLKPLLYSAAPENERAKVGPAVESAPERAGKGKLLSFVGSLILITIAFSVGFSYLLEKRWLRQAATKESSATGDALAEASASAPPTATPALFPLNPEALHVTAIALGHTHLAIVNGKRLGEGDTLTVKTSAGVATVRVEKIEDGVVLFAYGTGSIEAKLSPTGTKKPPP